MDDWAKKRLAELEAAAPVKRRNRKDAFVTGSAVVDRGRRQGHAVAAGLCLRVAAASRLEGEEPDLPVAQRSAGQARRRPAHAKHKVLAGETGKGRA